VQISPSFSLTHLILAAALAKLGEIDKAKATAAHVLQLQPDFHLGRHFAGADYAPELATSLTEALGATGLPAARRLLHCISPLMAQPGPARMSAMRSLLEEKQTLAMSRRKSSLRRTG